MKRFCTGVLGFLLLQCSGGGSTQTGSTTADDAGSSQDGATTDPEAASDAGADAANAQAYLMVCKGITNDMTATLRFRATGIEGSKFRLILGALASSARVLAPTSVASEPAELEDSDSNESTYTMLAATFNLPAEAVGTDLEIKDAKLAGSLPLADATLSGQIVKPTSLNYAGKCVFAAAKDGTAFTVATDKITIGNRTIVASDLQP